MTNHYVIHATALMMDKLTTEKSVCTKKNIYTTHDLNTAKVKSTTRNVPVTILY